MMWKFGERGVSSDIIFVSSLWFKLDVCHLALNANNQAKSTFSDGAEQQLDWEIKQKIEKENPPVVRFVVVYKICVALNLCAQLCPVPTINASICNTQQRPKTKKNFPKVHSTFVFNICRALDLETVLASPYRNQINIDNINKSIQILTICLNQEETRSAEINKPHHFHKSILIILLCRQCSLSQKLFADIHDHNAGTALQQVFSGHAIQKLIMKEMPGLLLSKYISTK
ncbi:hypothetical protein TNCV_2927681 [Trichonephila clavipes]|nr:hypothetical protein TNCV_2927681 [Trichonephila clavipes]